MNFRERRARAWAGLYVGLVGDADRSDDEADGQARPSRAEKRD